MYPRSEGISKTFNMKQQDELDAVKSGNPRKTSQAEE